MTYNFPRNFISHHLTWLTFYIVDDKLRTLRNLHKTSFEHFGVLAATLTQILSSFLITLSTRGEEKE